jgi:hypothetical protein
MNLVNFHEDDLPIKDMETIGLAAGGQLLLNVDDLKALAFRSPYRFAGTA